jgi:Type II secretion system (T2SS), protein E, N-terminal domain
MQAVSIALATRAPRMPLGLSLLSRGLITTKQLKKAAGEQKETGAEIAEILVRQQAVSEKQVTDIRAAEWGCPVFALPEHPVEVGVRIPSTLLEAYSMIPVHFAPATNLLLIGFVHGIDYGLLYTVERLTGCKTKPCFVTPSSFQLRMQQTRQMPKSSTKASSFEAIQSPAEIARTLCTTGLDIEADEAFIGRCREYMWARLKCRLTSVDLLFKIR